MKHNNILPVVLAGGKSKRFGEDKSQAKLRGKILIDYILREITNNFNEVLIVANNPINHFPRPRSGEQGGRQEQRKGLWSQEKAESMVNFVILEFM